MKSKLTLIILIFSFNFQHSYAEVAESSKAAETLKTPVTGAKPSAKIQELAQRFNNFKQCADRVWPGIKLTDRSISMIDLDGSKWRWENGSLKPATDIDMQIDPRRAYLVNRSRKPPEIILNYPSIEKSTQGKISASTGPKSGESKPPVANGTPAESKECIAAKENFVATTKSLKEPLITNPVDVAFKLGVHESFHVCDQTDVWHHKMTPNGSRITAYPAKTEPREMRYKIKMALNEALKTTDPVVRQKYLQEAAYWHKEYKSKYGVNSSNPEPHESTDLYEGTARYLDVVASNIDCSKDISADEFAETSRQAVLSAFSEKPSPSYDGESYELGALAGALLDQKKNSSWKNEAANNGKTALDQLLNSVTPTTGAFSKSQMDNYNKISKVMPIVGDQCFVKPDLDYLKNYKNSDYVWVSIPTTVYGGKGSYDGTSVIPGSSYVNVGGVASAGGIQVTGQPLVVTDQNPCGGQNSMMVLVPKDSINNNNVKYDNKAPVGKVYGIIDSTPKKSPLGSVYCATNQ